MTDHYFEDEFVKLHYYKYGRGGQAMLCFHGFGMHGTQFISLEGSLGEKYTFYGFDLFFHKQTLLSDQSIHTIKKGLSKVRFAKLIEDFCRHEGVDRFSVIGYSMGTHFATAVVEELGSRVDEYIVAAPAALNPGALIRFFSKNRFGNRLLEKIVLNQRMLFGLLKAVRQLGFVDQTGHNILYSEMATEQLRFNFYASLTYFRSLDTDLKVLQKSLLENHIKSIYIFGKHDRMYPPRIGDRIIPRLKNAEIVILDEDHEMIKPSFVNALTALLK